MINRINWKLVKEYIKFRLEVEQISQGSSHLDQDYLRHLLEWANEKSFEQAENIRPTFPEYLKSARLDGKNKPLSQIFIKKTIGSVRKFLNWLILYKRGYTLKIKYKWLSTLRAPRFKTENKEHEAVTLEEIRAIAKAPVYTLRDERIRAAAVFWFLSGIRIGAFVTLPIKAVDMNDLSIKQWPSLGVKTKFQKHATTHFLPFPDLLEVVKKWDVKIREKLSEDSFWFSPLSPDTGGFDSSISIVGKNRGNRASKDLREWLGKLGLPYHSPHKFRHGDAVTAIKMAKTVPELKAISQNLMHQNLSTTDGVYGILSKDDQKKYIQNLGK